MVLNKLFIEIFILRENAKKPYVPEINAPKLKDNYPDTDWVWSFFNRHSCISQKCNANIKRHRASDDKNTESDDKNTDDLNYYWN